MSHDYERRLLELQAALPSDSALQLHVMELARTIREQAARLRGLESVAREALDLLRQLPEDVLGRTACPGGGLQSNLFARVADLYRRAQITPT